MSSVLGTCVAALKGGLFATISFIFQFPMTKIQILNRVLLSAILFGTIFFLVLASVQCGSAPRVGRSETPLEKIPFDGKNAYRYLVALCEIGPRPTASEGMRRQQTFLEEHFRQCGGTVEYQPFSFAHPENGTPVQGANLIVRWKPERKERILLCAHYDTLPLPLLDPPGSQKPFVGAEDNASGVSILMQMGHSMNAVLEQQQKRYGVDFVFLDAEEFMFRPHGRFCRGSEYFGFQYAAQSPKERGFTYTCGVLLDLVGQHNVTLLKEKQSYQWNDTRPIVNEIWNTARNLGVREFRHQVMPSSILDDHVMLRNVGKIPTIDIIDLDYAPWHTSADTPDKCSPLSLARVGWVVSHWLANKP
ncbi:MAG: M28 family peptidase [Planctomycetia bacterium]|nr:M28 family peptidase [Planctomycetia bacterium]